MKIQISFCVLSLICLTTCHASLSDWKEWIWGDASNRIADAQRENLPLRSVPFELLTQDEKFLVEASKIVESIDLVSPLEICQQKAVLKLQSACGKLPEDELAKFSVELLNCQSAAEGRPLYTCTQEMTLDQCTSSMTPETWNAYHLISNRARAVCYNIKNMHFRAITEMTINRLIKSTQDQVKALVNLQENHEHLVDQAKEIHETLESNVEEAKKGKELISNSHEELNLLMMVLKQKLYNFSTDFQKNYDQHNESSFEILQDLKNVELQAGVVLNKIESSTDRILSQHEEIIAKYDETFLKIDQINTTVYGLWDLTSTIESKIQSKLNWILDLIGTSEKNYIQVYYTVSHIVYLISGMILTSFLNMSYLSKLFLVILVPTNLIIFCKHGSDVSLDLTSVTAILVLIFGVELLVRFIEFCRPKKASNVQADFSLKVQDYELLNNFSYSQYVVTKPSIFRRIINEFNYRCWLLKKGTLSGIDKVKQFFGNLMPTISSTEERSCSYVPVSKADRTRLVKLHANISEDLSDEAENSDDDDDLREKRSGRIKFVSNAGSKNVNEFQELANKNLNNGTSKTYKRTGKSINHSINNVNGKATRLIAETAGPLSLCASIDRYGKPCKNLPFGKSELCHFHGIYPAVKLPRLSLCASIDRSGKPCTNFTFSKSRLCHFHRVYPAVKLLRLP